MNIFSKAILLFSLVILIASCSKDDSDTPTVNQDYAGQRDKDMAKIVKFMKTRRIDVVNNSGADNDQDVSYTIVPENDPTSIWNQNEYPIKTHNVTLYQGGEDIEYTIYYLELRKGTGGFYKTSPCNVDQVLTSYRGERIYTDNSTSELKSEQFDELKQPETYFDLTATVTGWGEIFPKFKTGSYTGNPNGTLSYTGFGAGVMFLPSGLGYYNTTQAKIPAYSPLIFSIKLYEVQRADQDGDGVPSFQEDLNGDGYLVAINQTEIARLQAGTVRRGDIDADGKLDDNTDGVSVLLPNGTYSSTDEAPDYKDADDDNDYYLTIFEIKKPDGINSGLSKYFPYNPIIDNPATPTIVETETKGIPEYSATEPDYVSPGRLRIHVDILHHLAKP